MEVPQAAAVPLPPQLLFESAMVLTVDPTQQYLSEIDAVSSYSMVSSGSMFHCMLTDILSPPADRVNDPGSSSMTGSASLRASYNDTNHDLQEDARRTTMKFSAIYTLWETANEMRSEGHISECIQIFKTVSKAFLHTSLLPFGIEKQSTKDVRHLLSNELEERMDRCVKACDASCSILFPLEMKLCAKIFQGDEIDFCYSETIEDTLVQLIGYANSLIGARRLPGLLFKHLDLYTALVKLWSSPGVSRTKHWESSMDNLAEKIRCLLFDFEKSMFNELSTSTAPEAAGGGVVSLTENAIRYLMRMMEYEDILTDLIVSNPVPTDIGLDVDDAQLAGGTHFELHVVYILMLLRFKIESKAKQYYKADSTKSYLFLANNLVYIVKCVRDSSMVKNVPYMNKMETDLKQMVIKYQRKSCDDMLRCLRNNSAVRCFFGVQLSRTTTFKRRIKSFYSMFAEARFNQQSWMALIKELQPGKEQSVPVEEELVVAYTAFLRRFWYKDDQSVIASHVKYLPHQIQTLIAEGFFKI